LKEVALTRTPLIALFAVSLTALVVGACGSGDGDDDSDREDALQIVSTVSPITSLVENIAGIRADTIGLVPEGVNSHTYESPVSDAIALAEADLIILNGLSLEESVLELAEANKKDDAVILLLGNETITPEQYKFDFSFPESDGKPNPHVWPDVTLAMKYAELIRDAIVELDPDNSLHYTSNTSKLLQNLEFLDQRIRVAVQSIPQENRKLLTYHDSWAYFADRYDMEVIGAVQPSDFAEPSARDVADLIDQVKQEGVPAIFGSEVFPSPVLEQIADESGAEYIADLSDDDLPGEPGDPLHSYVGMMLHNMQVMVPALGGDTAPLDMVDPSLVFNGESRAQYPQ
jgi:ABC-type Zn uptake system ZnuABC Zn-binding protein ZnuA